MSCVNCGQEIEGPPTWAVYADPAFANKTQAPFPLHWNCFSESETVTVAEAHHVSVDTDGAAVYETRERTINRYLEVDRP